MAEMKDSGVVFIGNIPKEWVVYSVKHLFKIGRGRVISELELDDDGKYPVYSSQTKNEGCMGYINTYDFDIDQLTWTTDGVYAGTVFIRHGKHNCTNVCGTLQPNEKNDNDLQYLKYALECIATYHRRKDINGGKIMNNEMARIKIPIPPKGIQINIAEFLDKKCAEIDTLHSDIEKQIETLEEYKKSIITEAVTKGLDPDVEMKDSGIEWVGMIPKHWDVHPVYSYFGERKNRNKLGKETNLLSLSYGNIIRKDINTNGGLLPENFNNYNIVEANDIIIRPTDLQNDKHSLRTGLVTEHGIITSAYIDLYPKKNINSQFFHYLLHAYDLMKVFYNMGNGVRQGLNYSEFSRLMVYFPLPNEQKEIVEYLNTKCAEIDGVIVDKKKQLETLEQYKKSLIYEYVTGKKEVPDYE